MADMKIVIMIMSGMTATMNVEVEIMTMSTDSMSVMINR